MNEIFIFLFFLQAFVIVEGTVTGCRSPSAGAETTLYGSAACILEIGGISTQCGSLTYTGTVAIFAGTTLECTTPTGISLTITDGDFYVYGSVDTPVLTVSLVTYGKNVIIDSSGDIDSGEVSIKVDGDLTIDGKILADDFVSYTDSPIPTRGKMMFFTPLSPFNTFYSEHAQAGSGGGNAGRGGDSCKFFGADDTNPATLTPFKTPSFPSKLIGGAAFSDPISTPFGTRPKVKGSGGGDVVMSVDNSDWTGAQRIGTHGAGGGLIFLAVEGTLSIGASAILNVDGADGGVVCENPVNKGDGKYNDDSGCYGAGGGSGGSILLEAYILNLNGAAKVTASGGNGGFEPTAQPTSGCCDDPTKTLGSVGSGGMCEFYTFYGGGGAGGGGGGYITYRYNTLHPDSSSLSPTPTSGVVSAGLLQGSCTVSDEVENTRCDGARFNVQPSGTPSAAGTVTDETFLVCTQDGGFGWVYSPIAEACAACPVDNDMLSWTATNDCCAFTCNPTFTPCNFVGGNGLHCGQECCPAPSGAPTGQLTTVPSSVPSSLPTGKPTGQPTTVPSSFPSSLPTGFPTGHPTGHPTSSQPTGQPTAVPTDVPTGQPTGQPTSQPTMPTGQPTSQPTSEPTGLPPRVDVEMGFFVYASLGLCALILASPYLYKLFSWLFYIFYIFWNTFYKLWMYCLKKCRLASNVMRKKMKKKQKNAKVLPHIPPSSAPMQSHFDVSSELQSSSTIEITEIKYGGDVPNNLVKGKGIKSENRVDKGEDDGDDADCEEVVSLIEKKDKVPTHVMLRDLIGDDGEKHFDDNSDDDDSDSGQSYASSLGLSFDNPVDNIEWVNKARPDSPGSDGFIEVEIEVTDSDSDDSGASSRVSSRPENPVLDIFALHSEPIEPSPPISETAALALKVTTARKQFMRTFGGHRRIIENKIPDQKKKFMDVFANASRRIIEKKTPEQDSQTLDLHSPSSPLPSGVTMVVRSNLLGIRARLQKQLQMRQEDIKASKTGTAVVSPTLQRRLEIHGEDNDMDKEKGGGEEEITLDKAIFKTPNKILDVAGMVELRAVASKIKENALERMRRKKMEKQQAELVRLRKLKASQEKKAIAAATELLRLQEIEKERVREGWLDDYSKSRYKTLICMIDTYTLPYFTLPELMFDPYSDTSCDDTTTTTTTTTTTAAAAAAATTTGKDKGICTGKVADLKSDAIYGKHKHRWFRDRLNRLKCSFQDYPYVNIFQWNGSFLSRFTILIELLSTITIIGSSVSTVLYLFNDVDSYANITVAIASYSNSQNEDANLVYLICLVVILSSLVAAPFIVACQMYCEFIQKLPTVDSFRVEATGLHLAKQDLDSSDIISSRNQHEQEQQQQVSGSGNSSRSAIISCQESVNASSAWLAGAREDEVQVSVPTLYSLVYQVVLPALSESRVSAVANISFLPLKQAIAQQRAKEKESIDLHLLWYKTFNTQHGPGSSLPLRIVESSGNKHLNNPPINSQEDHRERVHESLADVPFNEELLDPMYYPVYIRTIKALEMNILRYRANLVYLQKREKIGREEQIQKMIHDTKRKPKLHKFRDYDVAIAEFDYQWGILHMNYAVPRPPPSNSTLYGAQQADAPTLALKTWKKLKNSKTFANQARATSGSSGGTQGHGKMKGNGNKNIFENGKNETVDVTSYGVACWRNPTLLAERVMRAIGTTHITLRSLKVHGGEGVVHGTCSSGVGAVLMRLHMRERLGHGFLDSFAPYNSSHSSFYYLFTALLSSLSSLWKCLWLRNLVGNTALSGGYLASTGQLSSISAAYEVCMNKFSYFTRPTILVSQFFKFSALLLLLIVNSGFAYLCVLEGRNHSNEWRKFWAVTTVLAALIYIFGSRLACTITSSFIGPEIIVPYVKEIRSDLYTSAHFLSRVEHKYHMATFSAYDYLSSAYMVALALPHLPESKLILMHRSPLPDRLLPWSCIRTRLRDASLYFDAFFFALQAVVENFISLGNRVHCIIIMMIIPIIVCIILFGLFIYITEIVRMQDMMSTNWIMRISFAAVLNYIGDNTSDTTTPVYIITVLLIIPAALMLALMLTFVVVAAFTSLFWCSSIDSHGWHRRRGLCTYDTPLSSIKGNARAATTIGNFCDEDMSNSVRVALVAREDPSRKKVRGISQEIQWTRDAHDEDALSLMNQDGCDDETYDDDSDENENENEEKRSKFVIPILGESPEQTEAFGASLNNTLNKSANTGFDPENEISSFSCPITQEIMTDPVMLTDGHTYERAAIVRWLQSSSISPRTGKVLPFVFLVPNHQLRQAIDEYKHQQV